MYPNKTSLDKPGPIQAKPLSALLGDVFAQAFAKQGFASREIVTRWAEIAGQEIGACSEPIKIQWPKPVEGQPVLPATLILRVDGPMALEIQHSSTIILERINRFFGWNAIGKLAIRQGPLSRPYKKSRPSPPRPEEIAKVAKTLDAVADPELRDALARLGAAIKRK